MILIPNVMNFIGIIRPVKLYLNLESESNFGSTFRHYPVDHTQWFTTLILGIQQHPLEGGLILSNRPHITSNVLYTVGHDARRLLMWTCF